MHASLRTALLKTNKSYFHPNMNASEYGLVHLEYQWEISSGPQCLVEVQKVLISIHLLEITTHKNNFFNFHHHFFFSGVWRDAWEQLGFQRGFLQSRGLNFRIISNKSPGKIMSCEVLQDIKNYITPSKVVSKSYVGVINNPMVNKRQGATNVLAN